MVGVKQKQPYLAIGRVPNIEKDYSLITNFRIQTNNCLKCLKAAACQREKSHLQSLLGAGD